MNKYKSVYVWGGVPEESSLEEVCFPQRSHLPFSLSIHSYWKWWVVTGKARISQTLLVVMVRYCGVLLCSLVLTHFQESLCTMNLSTGRRQVIMLVSRWLGWISSKSSEWENEFKPFLSLDHCFGYRTSKHTHFAIHQFKWKNEY